MRPGENSTTSKTTTSKAAKRKTAGRRRASRSALVRRWLAVGALVLVGLLYYRPLIAYKDAHGELARKRAAVAKLRQEKSRLQHRLGASTSIETLAREARALGYVKPNEHLFIVKGINGWRKRERASLARP
jgi:cell division protein FtsB